MSWGTYLSLGVVGVFDIRTKGLVSLSKCSRFGNVTVQQNPPPNPEP